MFRAAREVAQYSFARMKKCKKNSKNLAGLLEYGSLLSSTCPRAHPVPIRRAEFHQSGRARAAEALSNYAHNETFAHLPTRRQQQRTIIQLLGRTLNEYIRFRCKVLPSDIMHIS